MGFNCCVTNNPGHRAWSQWDVAGCAPKLPQQGHVLVPWVCLRFTADDKTITVGNHSLPSDKNTAVIKSFEYGHTDGFTVRVVIEDQKGGSMEAVADHLIKNWRDSATDKYSATFQFGWARAGCPTPLLPAQSDCYQGFLYNTETSYSQGKFFVEMTFADLMKVAQEGACEEHLGSEDHKIHVTDAITKLLTQTKEQPNIDKVSFLTMDNGIATPVEFEEGEMSGTKRPDGSWEFKGDWKFRGPRGYWRAEGEDKLQAAKNIMFHYMTKKKRGWVCSWDENYTKGGGRHLIFWENCVPTCVAESETWWQQRCVGKFMVNAGRDSNVIEFNPRMKWSFDYGMSVQGGIADTAVAPFTDKEEDASGALVDTGKTTKPTGRYECPPLARAKQPGAGKMMQSTPTQNQTDKDMGGAPEKNARSAEANMLADFRLMPISIEATLVIVGDPSLVDMAEMMGGKTIQITMINPFFLTGANPKYEWLAFPPENYVVRNSAWIVNGCTHKIEAGNYTTTLNLHLITPGVDGAPGQPLGLSTDGYVPKG